jgi:hypothetical protein
MRIFRKRKKFGNFRGTPEDAEPLPDIVYQMGAEAAAAHYASTLKRRQDPYAAINPAEQDAMYGLPYIVTEEENSGYEVLGDELGEQVRSSSPLNFLASAFGIRRSSSRERYANRARDNFVRAGSPVRFNQVRAGSPVYFTQDRPGSPVKFRRRPASPGLLQARAPSPLHFVQSEPISPPLPFAQPPRSTSPDVARRLYRAQLSQDLQRIEKQQKHQQEMLMLTQMQSLPQYQQVQQPYYPTMNSHVSLPAYPMMQQPQTYSFY